MNKAKKRVLSIMLTLCMAISLFPAQVFAASDPSNFVFDISEGAITISAGSTSDTIKVVYGGRTEDNIPAAQQITLIGTSTTDGVTVDGIKANLMIDNLNIDRNSYNNSAFGIKNAGKLNLTLWGNSTLKSGTNCAGLQVPGDAEIVITAQTGGHTLTAVGGRHGAGIGGGIGGDAGNITISGDAKVKARGGDSLTASYSGNGSGGGAGIGGGGGTGDGKTVPINGGNLHSITIHEGVTVEAIGGNGGKDNWIGWPSGKRGYSGAGAAIGGGGGCVQYSSTETLGGVITNIIPLPQGFTGLTLTAGKGYRESLTDAMGGDGAEIGGGGKGYIGLTTAANPNHSNDSGTNDIGYQPNPRLTTPAAAIDYLTEKIIDLTPGNYTFKADATQVSVTGIEYSIDSTWYGTDLAITQKGDGTTTSDSITQNLSIPARPAAPVGVGTVNSTSGATNGRLTGVADTMEYSANGGTTWTSVVAGKTTVTGIPAGSYLVRTSGTVTAFVGENTAVTVGNTGGGGVIPIPPSYTISFDANAGSQVAGQTIDRNGMLVKPVDPIRNKHRFTGWYTDKAGTIPYDFKSGVTNAFALYAGWTWANPFNDVNVGNWFYDNIEYVHLNDLFEGTSSDTFSPGVPTTRGMLAALLWRMEGNPEPQSTKQFTDLTSDWSQKAIIWANEQGIVLGYGGGVFGETDDITREQTVAILYRYTTFKGYDISENTDIDKYEDVSLISSYALSSFKWATANGLIKGRTDTRLCPKDAASRAEIAAVLHRFCKIFDK